MPTARYAVSAAMPVRALHSLLLGNVDANNPTYIYFYLSRVIKENYEELV